MTSRLEKQIKEMSLPEKVVTVAKRCGEYKDTSNDDIGRRYEYELKYKDLCINVFYSEWESSSYARATIKGRTVFSGERFWNVNCEEDRSYTSITRSKPKLEQLEKLLLEICRKHQRKR